MPLSALTAAVCRRLWFGICLLLLLPTGALAESDQSSGEQLNLIDLAHQEISYRLTATSQWFDEFFSDPRSEEETAGTLLRLQGSTTLTQGEGLSYDGQIKARLNLPNLQRRFHLVLSSEEENTTIQDSRINQDLAGNKNNQTLALQYTQQRSSTFSLIHRIQLDLDNGLNPQIRSRLRYTLPVAKQSLLSLTQTIFWEYQDGFGEESRIDFDLPVDENMLFRTTGRGLFSETSQGYEWLVMQQWLISFNERQALSLGAFCGGETHPKGRIAEYNLFSKFRQRFIKEWLFIELHPELYWRHDDDFRPTAAFTLTLEIQLGD